MEHLCSTIHKTSTTQEANNQTWTAQFGFACWEGLYKSEDGVKLLVGANNHLMLKGAKLATPESKLMILQLIESVATQ
jgi:hypothetical protein